MSKLHYDFLTSSDRGSWTCWQSALAGPNLGLRFRLSLSHTAGKAHLGFRVELWLLPKVGVALRA